MNIRFDKKVAIITGGATGIGAATAKLLCESGAAVAILDRNADAARTTALSLTNAGHAASFYACDVAEEEDVRRATDMVAQQYGRIDMLVHSAGIQTYGTVVDTPSEVWDRTFDVHVKGCFYAARFAIPAMVAAGGGAVVIVASVQSFTAITNSAAYVAAKHALLGLTRSIALDYAQQGIRANCICPGAIDTPMLRATAAQSGSPDSLLTTLGRMHAVGRIGRPEEVASAITFLLSDAASFITGATLMVDGGLLVPTGGMGFQESGISAQGPA